MKLLKPNWVSHDGNPIFSVDLHPDGSRFATGGQGDGGCSGKVVVWNTSPVISAKDEHNENVPKILCVMDNHLACVNCVRWSCNGRYLASGGDDRLIMIWQFAGYGGAVTFGSSSVQANSLNGERWRCTHTLKKHTGDILHLAWSPADQWLASCSIDNTVVVWNAHKFPEVTAVLKGHTSLVKGVTWDPVGTYLASQSDDKTVRVWKTLDWKMEVTVVKPFEECGATTHVLRLDWSPDGGYLVSAHAMNNSGPTAQIIEREGWRTNMDFVGHRKAITCTRFNGRMFRRHPSKASKQPRLPYTCCAVGSRDRSLSVWLTSLRRPLAVINDLFEDSVMDISWSYSGLGLICCSWDGSVAYLEFKPHEIGEALSREEMNELHTKTYGKSMSILSQPLVIENPAMLAIQQKKAGDITPSKDKKSPSQEPVTPIKYPTKQIEVRTPTGRRRITPIFVAGQEQLAGVPRPFGSSSTFGSSTNLSSNISKSPSKMSRTSSTERTPHKKSDSEKEKHDTSLSSVPEQESMNQNAMHTSAPKHDKQDVTKVLTDKSHAANVLHSSFEKLKTPEPLKEKHKSRVDQKKVFLDHRLSEKTKSSPAIGDKPEKNKSPKETSLLQKAKFDTGDKTLSLVEPPPKAVITPSQSKKAGKAAFTVKRKAGDGTLPSHASPKQPKRLKKDHGLATPDQQKQYTAQQSLHSKLGIQVKHERLPSRKINKILSAEFPQDSSIGFKLFNDLNALQGKSSSGVMALHKICRIKDSATEWESVLSSPGVVMNASEHILCAACVDKSIHVLSSRSGRRVMPILCISDKPYEVRCNKWRLMIVCTDASVSIWDAMQQKSLMSERSFTHLVPAHDQIVTERRKQSEREITDDGSSGNDDGSEALKNSPLRSCILTDAGLPLLTFANGQTYTFSQNMCCWVRVHSMHGAVEQHATYKTPLENEMLRDGVLCSLMKDKSEVAYSASRMFHANPLSQRAATLVLLENRIESCIALNSPSEYRFWLFSYIKQLVNDGLDARLREVCDSLLGPTHVKSIEIDSAKTSSFTLWKPYVLGIFKRHLLRDEILPIVGSNLNFQRIYTEYHDQLDGV